MARRASTSIQPAKVTMILGGVGIALAGGFLVFGWLSDPFRATPALDAGAYLENSNSLRGNTYQFTGTISDSLGWSAQKGRLYAAQIEEGGRGDAVAVLVPPQHNQTNIQKGQRFRLKVQVDEQGILVVSSLAKR